MIHFQLNGENHTLDAKSSTVAQLIKQLDLENKRFAVEINEEIVTRSDYPTIQINNGDNVEIVQAIGGG